eukprot:jgi/Mesvir1/6851/Mv09024-RA.1
MSQSRSPFWAPRNSHSRFDMGISNVDKSRFLHDSSLGLDGTWDKSLDMHASQRRTSGPKVTTSRGARPVSARPMSSLASSKDSINEDYRFLQEYRVDNNISMGRAVRPKSAPRERLPGMRAKADPKLSLSQIIDDHRSPDHRLEKVNLASFRLEDSMAGRRERSSRSFQVSGDACHVFVVEPVWVAGVSVGFPKGLQPVPWDMIRSGRAFDHRRP